MTMPENDTPLIDWTRCVQLREEVGKEDFAEVVELFLSEVDADIAALDISATPQSLCDQLHGLKGSALNLGFATFADLCQQFEQVAGRGGFDAQAKRALQTCFSASKAELDAALSRAAVA